MIHTGVSRYIRDPLDVRGLPTVTPLPPIPGRATSLEGTKTLLVPKVSSGFRQMMSLPMEDPGRNDRLGRVLGIVAMVQAVMLVLGLALVDILPGLPGGLGPVLGGLAVVCLLGVHLCAIFSQVVSNGRSLIGGLSVLVLYGGIWLVMLIGWLVA